MARSQNKAKQKPNVKKNQSTQAVRSSRKRNKPKETSDSQAHGQNKRRRTCRYNLRESNSVILVGETPCCQTPEQNEKYTRLGLNSALFLQGSQRPKRKQSHISIITISSDDEETSEERTTEWVNSLDQNFQSVENDYETMGPNETAVKMEPDFHPLCSSTPHNSRSTVQFGSEEQNAADKQGSAMSSSELPTGEGSEEVNAPKIHDDLSSMEVMSNELLRPRSSPMNNQVNTEETFQVIISISDRLGDSEPVMRNPPESYADSSDCCDAIVPDCKSLKEDSGSRLNSDPGFNSTPSNLSLNAPANTGSSTGFYFGTPTDTRNFSSTPLLPFNSNFNIPMEHSISEACGFGLATSNGGQGESKQFDVTCTDVMNKTSGQIESKPKTSNDPDIFLERKSHSNSSY